MILDTLYALFRCITRGFLLGNNIRGRISLSEEASTIPRVLTYVF
jgi:hypothetical protein